VKLSVLLKKEDMIHSIEKKVLTQSKIALHQMVNQLTIRSLPETIKNDNVIHNHVPAEIRVGTDAHKLAAVIDCLLRTVVNHTRNTALTVSIKSFSNVILLYVKGNTTFDHPELEKKLVAVHQLAESIGGTVGITSFRNNISTIALSFINSKAAC
jgi:hypothetical protein